MILEAEDGGFFKATSSDYNFSKVIDGLGEKFDTEDVVIKPYAACGSLHSSIDAVLTIKREKEIDLERIEKINVYNSEMVNLQCGFDYRPMGALQAQMSLKYCVARAILDGMITLSQFKDEKLSDPAAVNLAGRVHFVKHDEINKIYPLQFPSIVELVLTDGTKHEARVDSPKGSAKNPMTWEEVKVKFKMNSSEVIHQENAETIIDQVINLENLNDVSVLLNLLKT